MEEQYRDLLQYLEPISKETEYKAISATFAKAETFAINSFSEGSDVRAAFAMMNFYLRDDFIYDILFRNIYTLFTGYLQSQVNAECIVTPCIDINTCKEVQGYLTGIQNGLYKLYDEMVDIIRNKMGSDLILLHAAYTLEEIVQAWSFDKEFYAFISFLHIYVTEKLRISST